MRTRTIRAAVFLLASMAAASVWAADSRRSTAQDPAAYGWLSRYQVYPAFGKLGRGAGNVLTGWLEVPLAVQERYVRRDPVTTFVTGAAIGLAKGFTRTLVGTYEVVTFWLPYPDKFGPVLPPLEYFSQAPPRWR